MASSTFRCVATRCEADRWARVAPIASCGAYLCCFGLSLPERQHAMCAKTACNFTFLYHKQTTFPKRDSDLFSEKSADAQESASLPAAIGHRSHIAERAVHSGCGSRPASRREPHKRWEPPWRRLGARSPSHASHICVRYSSERVSCDLYRFSSKPTK